MKSLRTNRASQGFALALTMLCAAAPVTWAEEAALTLEKVTDRVYAIVGPFGNRTPENLGNNATFGLVIGEDEVVLIDPGGSYRGAAAIDEVIRGITDKPVTMVINTGGQDHRWLGNGYFGERGARIVASEDAVADQKSRRTDQLLALDNLIGSEGLAGTEAVYADLRFADSHAFDAGGIRFELRHVGPAHTPGDTLVWLPDERVVFSGDVVYVGRMLGVIGVSSSANWLSAFDRMAALGPVAIVPGHGPVTNLESARRDTRDYLVFLRDTVRSYMDGGGDIMEVGALDQSAYALLHSYEELKGRNAQRVFEELEWE